MTTALQAVDSPGVEYSERMIKLMDDASQEFDELMCSALPYFFSGMRSAQVATSLTSLTGKPINSETLWNWMGNEKYARYVAQGRSLMRQWNLMQLQQLAVISYDILRNELAGVPIGEDEEKRQIETAKFIIRELGKTRPREVRHQIDDPSLHVAAESAILITDRIARLIESGGTHSDRDVWIGECTTVDRDDMDAVSMHDNVVPQYGVMHVDWGEGRLQCHACGKWVDGIDVHAVKVHGISIAEYKKAYGIAEDIPLSFSDMNRTYSWRGQALTSVDEERGLVPYEKTFSEMAESDGRQNEETDSGSV